MKRILLLAIFLGGVSVLPIACGKNLPTSTSSGSSTTTPTVSATATATVNNLSFQSAYQNSVSPTSSYSGETDAWISGTSFGTIEGSSPYLEINTKNELGTVNPNGFSRTLVKFTGVNIPSNVTVLGAEVWLTTETATNVTAPVTVGIHTFSSSVYNPSNISGSCLTAWTSANVNWNGVGGTTWASCDGSAGTNNINYAYFNATPNSTLVFSASDNGTSSVKRFFLNTADIQAELASGTIQFVVRSEGESTLDTTTSLVGFYPNTDASGNAPKLLISYQ